MEFTKLAQKIAAESIVLLKNEQNLLPLEKGAKVAFFGRAQQDAIISGNGSGSAHKASFNAILTACENARLVAEPGLKAHYLEQIARVGNDVVMPGGPPAIAQIQKGFEEGRITRADLEKAVAHLLAMTARFDGKQGEV